jgi:hypothetical protein
MLYFIILLQLELIFGVRLSSTVQQCQELELNPSKIRHCSTGFGLVGHD